MTHACVNRFPSVGECSLAGGPKLVSSTLQHPRHPWRDEQETLNATEYKLPYRLGTPGAVLVAPTRKAPNAGALERPDLCGGPKTPDVDRHLRSQ